MFSGIIQYKGEITDVVSRGGMVRVSLRLPRGWKLRKGQSVAVDGICSTVVAFSAKTFTVEYMPETLRVTTAAVFRKKQMINLELSLRYGGRVDGHFVQGHIEGVGMVTRVVHRGDSKEITLAVPRALQRFLAAKGSVAINGASLTIARKDARGIMLALVPYTHTHTNLGLLKKGDRVNIETDLLARQLAAML